MPATTEQTASPEARQCLILGAGFSKAISGSMPIMSDLTREVAKRINMDIPRLATFNYNIEQWMSFLASPQPWLSEPENLRNRAKFLQISQIIYEIVLDSELEALKSPPPRWLNRLVEHVSNLQSGIITFNYDLLFERAAFTLGRGYKFSQLYVAPLVERMAPGTGYFVSAGESPRSTVQLFKLHGSINWLAQPSAAAGGSTGLFIEKNGQGWGNKEPGPRTKMRHADLVRMIVPPIAVKDSFYANDALNAQWRMASARFQTADELIICGYSFPDTDSSVRALIRNSLPAGVPITVVDPDESALVRIQEGLAGDGHTFRSFSSLGEYVDTLDVHEIEWCAVLEDGKYRARIEFDGEPIVPLGMPDLTAVDRGLMSEEAYLDRFIEGRWGDAYSTRRPSKRLGPNGQVGMTSKNSR